MDFRFKGIISLFVSLLCFAVFGFIAVSIALQKIAVSEGLIISLGFLFIAGGYNIYVGVDLLKYANRKAVKKSVSSKQGG